MPERPPDPQLEAATNRWMQAGAVLMALLILAFPAYRFYEPSGREDARQEHVASLIAQGETLFSTNCAACHGEEGLGGVAPALNSQQFLASASDEQIAILIAVGVPGSAMSAYSLDHGGPLTIAQIDALTAYLRSLEETAPDNPDWRAMVGG
jgi:mono/diheme cytochrome c family protein